MVYIIILYIYIYIYIYTHIDTVGSSAALPAAEESFTYYV